MWVTCVDFQGSWHRAHSSDDLRLSQPSELSERTEALGEASWPPDLRTVVERPDPKTAS